MNEELVLKAISGNKEAFCELYGLYKDRLYRYAFYKLGDPDDAEDAVSDCVLQAWKGLPDLRSPKAFNSWIFKILAACCAKRIKAMIDERDNLSRIHDVGFGHPSIDPQRSAELAEALSQLKDEDREIVLLSVVAGLKSNEIAEYKGITAGTVRSRISRSLKKMREFLSQGEK